MDSETLQARAADIRLAVFDVDGVMTDGRLYLSDQGVETKAFHSRDGLGLKALMRHGIEVAVITARQSRLVELRTRELGIGYVLQGREDKAAALDELMSELALTGQQVAYAGDDLVDLPALRACGLRFVPADGDSWLREQVAHRVTRAAGGRGAVREICEILLEARGEIQAFREYFQ